MVISFMICGSHWRNDEWKETSAEWQVTNQVFFSFVEATQYIQVKTLIKTNKQKSSSTIHLWRLVEQFIIQRHSSLK